VQAKLYEKTRQQVKQLRQLHEEREEFLSTVSHELRTPLTSMMLAIRMLRQADLSVDRRDRYLGILEQQCLQETQLINDLLALRKLETSSVSVQLQKLDIRYLIRDTAQSIEESLMQRNLRLVLDLPSQPLIVYTEPDSLNRIITELLTNACKYSIPQSEVSVSILHEANPPTHQIRLLVQNTGAGILPEELPYIFDKFRRCQGVTQQAVQGTGLGLALVKGLVQHLGGTIAASSQPMDGDRALWQTRFTVALPQYPDNLMQTFA
jgi:signal transduction histidine kinase